MRANIIRRFLASEEGVTSVEYALLLSLIVLVGITAWRDLGHTLFVSLTNSVDAIKQ
jgi:Flp pilus assembly pilin Flp